MSYTADSPIVGVGQVTDAATIDAWVRAKGQALAPQYAPDQTYADPGPVGASILKWSAQYGVNSDLVASQFVHETAGGQSAIYRAKWNTAGIGAVNNNAAAGAITFASADASFQAQCAHLADYAVGRGSWTASDPRAAVMAGLFGSAPTLAGLDGRWAYPGVGYGAALAAGANELVTFVAQSVSTAVSSVSNQGGNVADPNRPTSIYGIPVSMQPAASGNYDTTRGTVRLFIVHDEEASTAGSAVGRFQTAGQQASSHFVTDPANGQIIQCVSLDHTAYTCGNYALNQASVNVENPGYASKPYPDTIVDYCARVAAYVCNLYNIPVRWLTPQQVAAGAAGICGHQDVPDPNDPTQFGGLDHHTDPGPLWPRDHFIALVQQYQSGGQAQPATPEAQPQAAPVPANVRRFDGNPHEIHDGFKVFWEKLEAQGLALLVLGYPQSDETPVTLPEGVRTLQLFERGALIYEGNNPPPWDNHLATLSQLDALRAALAKPA